GVSDEESGRSKGPGVISTAWKPASLPPCRTGPTRYPGRAARLNRLSRDRGNACIFSIRQNLLPEVFLMKRENNFDIMRLLLAIVVIFFHVGWISGAPIFAPLPRYFSGHLAVEGFFAISGFLI